MLANRLNAALIRRNIHYGWVVAGVTFLVMLTTAGSVGSSGVMLVPLQQEFGWGTDQISTSMALRLVLYGLMGPFAAALINRHGLRRVIMTAMVMIFAGLVASLAMTQLWQLVVLWGLVVGIGTGMTAVVLGATVSNSWFTARRGLVVGLMTASTATGQLIFLPPLAALTEAYGWRMALALPLVMLAVALVAVWLLMRNRPADLGLRPYGEVGAASAAPPPAVPSASGPSAFLVPLIVLRDVSGSLTFWILFATFFVCGASTVGLIQTHFIAMCGDFGLAPVMAAGVLAMMGAFDFVGTVGSGWLSDRYDNRWLLFWYYGLRGLSLLYLPYTDFTIYGLTIFAMFYGLDWIATVPPTVKLVADRFGRERANVVFGWIFAGHQLGAAAVAYGAGYSREVYETYLPAFVLAGALCLIAAALCLTLGRPAPQRPLAAAA
ncbi:MFS transporter [Zavarzinia sp. CC-PAN008]|uniref:MFS transporter n=1 Tax=Zavarzinia sp. CC-PAN008 TaxID=3243332 RepID=UPI003F74A5EB